MLTINMLGLGKLYVVATPIGNLGDISQRMVEVLSRVDRIYAEDTRRSYQLLSSFASDAEVVSYHDHNAQKRLPEVLSFLKSGRDVALVSDAGMPLINDPGFKLVREAIGQGIKVVPVPGASAVITALVASGLPPYPFLFLGYLPRKQIKRRKLLQQWHQQITPGTQHLTLVAFESPYRVVDALGEILDIFGEETQVSVAREMTKLHEEFIRGRVGEVLEGLEKREKIKGEITLVWAAK